MVASISLQTSEAAKVVALAKRKDWLPARYILTALTFWGMCLIFAQRVCLNVAMVAMVNSSVEESLTGSEADNDSFPMNYRCPDAAPSNATFNYQQGTYPWTPSVQGLILGSYFYGYVFTQVIGGKLADLCGAKWLFASATMVSSLLSFATPAIAGLERGSIYMIALRVVLGMAHGMNYPSAYTLFSRWAPIQERGAMLSWCVIGTHFGVVLSMPLTGYLCEFGFAGGWPSAFYLLGVMGCVWFAAWVFLVFESPALHPRITAHELDFIQSNLPTTNSTADSPTPWLKIACSPPVWAVTVAKFTGAWSFICFQTKLPAYLDEVLHFPIQKNGMVNALLFGALCISIVSTGTVSDLIRMKYNFRTTTIRKCFESVALFGPALCMVAIPQVGCNATAVVMLLTTAMALFGCCGGGDVSVIVDMAPDYAGKIFGVSNAFASVPGILAPILAGLFLEGNKGDFRQWTYIFYICVGLYLFGAVVFLIFGSAEPQPWGTASCSADDVESCSKKEKKQPPEDNPTIQFSRKFSITSMKHAGMYHIYDGIVPL